MIRQNRCHDDRLVFKNITMLTIVSILVNPIVMMVVAMEECMDGDSGRGLPGCPLYRLYS